jgi:DNA polymerase III alpha subunit (gram-positive type)
MARKKHARFCGFREEAQVISLVFDTETTGIPKHPNAQDEVQPRIIEFGGILVDGSGTVLEELSLLFNPDEPLEEVITKITGLTDDDLKDEPRFGEKLSVMRVFFSKADVMIAHNLPFDKTMMELELERAKVESWPWPKIEICTVQEHADEWGRRPKLVELYEHYTGEKLAQKHRAVDDVKALAIVCEEAGVLL